MNSALDLYFPASCGVEIIATPGRYYVTSAFTFAASITAREEAPVEQPASDGRWDDGLVGRWAGGMSPPMSLHHPEPCSPPEEESGSKKSLVYHLSDGIYGAFSCLLFDRPCPTPQLHKVRVWPDLMRAPWVPHIVWHVLSPPWQCQAAAPRLRARGEPGPEAAAMTLESCSQNLWAHKAGPPGWVKMRQATVTQ